MKKRTLVIGDIHGNAKGLEQVLDRCNFDPKQDKIIQIGDVADGWRETSECVDILLDIKEKSVNKPVFIRGNHDVWARDWILFGRTHLIWERQGGLQTMGSYYRTEKHLEESHRKFWLKGQKDWYIDDENRIYIHGGWDYKTSTIKNTLKSAGQKVFEGTIAKVCHWDRSLYYDSETLQNYIERGFKDYNKKLQKVLMKFKEIYIGHTASKEHKVENYMNLWNTDSGSGWNGRLSIIDVDTKEIWYSDFSKDLYPNE